MYHVTFLLFPYKQYIEYFDLHLHDNKHHHKQRNIWIYINLKIINLIIMKNLLRIVHNSERPRFSLGHETLPWLLSLSHIPRYGRHSWAFVIDMSFKKNTQNELNHVFQNQTRQDTYLINSNSFGSETRILRAKFQLRWTIGTILLKLCNLFHSYRSMANEYWRAVSGPTFQAILLHQPTDCTQWTHL